jgi:hypothetical protein
MKHWPWLALALLFGVGCVAKIVVTRKDGSEMNVEVEPSAAAASAIEKARQKARDQR